MYKVYKAYLIKNIMPSVKVEGGYWKHKCAVCGLIWYSRNENPKVCSNVNCTNRTNWKKGNKRKISSK